MIVAFILTSGHVLAHEDFYVTKVFGNVTTRIKTGFDYEEINNVAMLGQLAEKLCKALKYSEPVFLDFIHCYVGNCASGFFISYDNVNNEYLKWSGNPINGDAIVVRQIARHFQSQTTLKLLEYAILNLKHIKSTQRQISYQKGYYRLNPNSIDTLAIKRILITPNSDLLNNTLKIRIDRPDKDFRYGVSYYLQNNRYFVHRNGAVLFDFDNIYDFKRTGNLGNWVIIFDSDSSFYYAGGLSQKSQRHVIEKPLGYQPFKVEYIGEGKVAIYFWYWKKEREEDEVGEFFSVGTKQRTLLYLSEEDKLIQNLNKLLKNQ